MTDEFIYGNGASSLDVRTCEACSEAAYTDGEGIKRCAGCGYWCHPWCAVPDGGIKTDDGWFDTAECLKDYHAVDDGPEPVDFTSRDAFHA